MKSCWLNSWPSALPLNRSYCLNLLTGQTLHYKEKKTQKSLFLKMIIYTLYFNVHKKGEEFPGLHFQLLRCEYLAHSNS